MAPPLQQRQSQGVIVVTNDLLVEVCRVGGKVEVCRVGGKVEVCKG